MFKFLTLTLFILFTTISPSAACSQQDLTALLSFKNSFPPNSISNSWTTAIDCCSWDYIQCDETSGRVTTLSISDNRNLRGPIPPSIGDLSALQVVSFSNLPGLIGPIPPQLSKLKALQFLTMYKTKVSGPVPSFLSTFTGLRELELAESNFVGTIPSSLGNLVNLSFIDLSGNQLTGAIPDSLFSKLTGSLADLDVSDNTLKGPIPKSFGRVRFANVNLGSNQLDGDASFLFGESKTVSQVILSKNKFAFDLTNVKYPQNLQYLDISHNKIYGSISNQITNLTNFGYLDVSYNELCGRIPSGGSFRQFEAQFFANNKCLCGAPLPPCD
ncbi:polygalacturonase inhibitor-like [Asparagus officinalis]|uniref:polygalacturonase inhibitor-like n=1 Tax=Asparagus officinalis TaxID=4686 RepID=UPI00098E788B|nr:polygalacturonase inhibitor-like [Asparagus officinalis]